MHIAKYLGKLIGKPVVAKWMNFHKTVGGGRRGRRRSKIVSRYEILLNLFLSVKNSIHFIQVGDKHAEEEEEGEKEDEGEKEKEEPVPSK